MIVLFDFDGVVMDTETQYTVFWDKIGLKILGLKNFGLQIKGMTLSNIYREYFDDVKEQIPTIQMQLDQFEKEMTFHYIPGILSFFHYLKKNSIHSAIVTSSNKIKLERVFKVHPDLPSQVDFILKSEDFKKSKPHPECFITAMQKLVATPEETYIFEDSINGLKAARASGAHVIALATTYSHEFLEPLSDVVINDFTDFDITFTNYFQNVFEKC